MAHHHISCRTGNTIPVFCGFSKAVSRLAKRQNGREGCRHKIKPSRGYWRRYHPMTGTFTHGFGRVEMNPDGSGTVWCRIASVTVYESGNGRGPSSSPTRSVRKESTST